MSIENIIDEAMGRKKAVKLRPHILIERGLWSEFKERCKALGHTPSTVLEHVLSDTCRRIDRHNDGK